MTDQKKAIELGTAMLGVLADADLFATRRAKINDEMDGTNAFLSGFEIPSEPGRYLVVEVNSGDRTWAYSCGSLEECARDINDSDTIRDEAFILDLDSPDGDTLDVGLDVSRITGPGVAWEKQPSVSPFSPRELATVMYALRQYEKRDVPTLRKHINLSATEAAFALDSPLFAHEIDSLCERLSAAKPESVNADLLAACKEVCRVEFGDDATGEDAFDELGRVRSVCIAAIARAEAATPPQEQPIHIVLIDDDHAGENLLQLVVPGGEVATIHAQLVAAVKPYVGIKIRANEWQTTPPDRVVAVVVEHLDDIGAEKK